LDTLKQAPISQSEVKLVVRECAADLDALRYRNLLIVGAHCVEGVREIRAS
jgi:hypothetical protein